MHATQWMLKYEIDQLLNVTRLFRFKFFYLEKSFSKSNIRQISFLIIYVILIYFCWFLKIKIKLDYKIEKLFSNWIFIGSDDQKFYFHKFIHCFNYIFDLKIVNKFDKLKNFAYIYIENKFFLNYIITVFSFISLKLKKILRIQIIRSLQKNKGILL